MNTEVVEQRFRAPAFVTSGRQSIEYRFDDASTCCPIGEELLDTANLQTAPIDDLAGIGGARAGQEVQQGRLAAAVVADQPDARTH